MRHMSSNDSINQNKTITEGAYTLIHESFTIAQKVDIHVRMLNTKY